MGNREGELRNDRDFNHQFVRSKLMLLLSGLVLFALMVDKTCLNRIDVTTEFVTLVLVNLFLTWHIAKYPSYRKPTIEIYLSIVLDLYYVGVLVGHTGALKSPLILLFPLVMNGVGMWSPSLGAFLTAGLAGHLAYAAGLARHYGSLEFYLRKEFWAIGILAGAVFAQTLGIIKSIREKNIQLYRQTEDLQALADDLRAANARLAELAVTDPMTGLYNNRHFQQRLREEMTRAIRHGTPLALIMMDIDNFKHYNDTFGHPEGDELLTRLAGILRETVREGDVVCRYGGEEFAIILPQTDAQEAFLVADRVRNAVEECPFPGREQQPHGKVTLSAGIAVYPVNASTVGELIKRADEALYKAKQQDKNTVHFYYSMVEELRDKIARGEIPLLNTLQTLVTVINAKDRYTYGHSERVVRYATALAQRLGLSKHEVALIRYAALVHDIGKIEISRDILNKCGPLDPQEREIIRQHPGFGAGIISSIADLKDIVPMVLHHHERFDGAGYPGGIHDGEIPMGARILALADSYDAMRSNRPYRPAMSSDEALEEIRRCAGSQFEPNAAEMFIEVIQELEGKPKKAQRKKTAG